MGTATSKNICLILSFAITEKQDNFVEEIISRGFFFSKSEVYRHAVFLFLTTVNKHGYIPNMVNAFNDTRGEMVIKRSSKFTYALLSGMVEVAKVYNLSRAAIIRLSIDYMIEWMENELTSGQESYLCQMI